MKRLTNTNDLQINTKINSKLIIECLLTIFFFFGLKNVGILFCFQLSSVNFISKNHVNKIQQIQI